MATTQIATEVFVLERYQDSEIKFKVRTVEESTGIRLTYRPDSNVNFSEMRSRLEDKIQQNLYHQKKHKEQKALQNRFPIVLEKKVRDKNVKIQKVQVWQRKRLRLWSLYSIGLRDIPDLRARTGYSWAFIDKWLKIFDLTSQPPADRITDSQNQINFAIDSQLMNKEDPFFTAPKIKRSLGQNDIKVSRTRITKRIKKAGYRWKTVKKMKKKVYQPVTVDNLNQARTILSYAFTAVENNEDVILFGDQIKLPISQYPMNYWGLGFVAVQFYLNELKAKDSLYFWTIVDQYYSLIAPRYKVLLDSAPWQKNQVMLGGPLANKWLFNIKQLYSMNLIEACFSFVRSRWRERPLSQTIEEEVKALVRIFKEFNDQEYQVAMRRQYYRNLLDLINRIDVLEFQEQTGIDNRQNMVEDDYN